MSCIQEVAVDGVDVHVVTRTTGSVRLPSFVDQESITSSAPARREHSDSSWYAAVFLIINAALGAGLLDFPQAFDQAGGIAASLILQAVVLIFVVVALLVLARCAETYKCSTYQEVVQHTCGMHFQRICSIAIALYCYGTCITFLVIIGDFSDRLFASLYDASFCLKWYMRRDFVITAVSVFTILPMCFSQKIDFLKIPSALGVLSAFYLVFLVVLQYYIGGYVPQEMQREPGSVADVFGVIPVICFGYQCHVSSVPIYSCMEDRRIKTFSKTVLTAIFLTALMYTIAGVYGYLTFGHAVVSDILEMYDASNIFVLIGIVAMAAKIVTTYPILAFCGRIAVNDLYVQIKTHVEHITERQELWRRILVTSVWFTTSLIVACLVPGIGLVIHIIGSLAAVFIFVFPGICLLLTSMEKDVLYYYARTKWTMAASVLFIAIGMFIFGQVLTQSIMEATVGNGHASKISLCHLPALADILIGVAKY
ncbi:sodium-coupled neutral amino acid transporter 7-like [Ornithodoros turicata]|uniref:sodium-coupled neutral amino acid transporter 7-like n=1 Tax=Ornithodoros turicata TaxID=34597 RepID=UPI003139EFF8